MAYHQLTTDPRISATQLSLTFTFPGFDGSGVLSVTSQKIPQLKLAQEPTPREMTSPAHLGPPRTVRPVPFQAIGVR